MYSPLLTFTWPGAGTEDQLLLLRLRLLLLADAPQRKLLWRLFLGNS